MNINGINSNNVINFYSKNKNRVSQTKEVNNVSDRIEISKLGKRIILAVKQQKETNELLIRQQMSFNNQVLNIINPRREMKTYNSYGNLSR